MSEMEHKLEQQGVVSDDNKAKCLLSWFNDNLLLGYRTKEKDEQGPILIHVPKPIHKRVEIWKRIYTKGRDCMMEKVGEYPIDQYERTEQ